MDKKNFRFFGIFVLLVSILILSFVLAGIVNKVEGLVFSQNTTATYDNDGTVALNWTADNNAISYNITIWADGVSLGDSVNDSVTGYTYTNISTESNFTFNVAAVNTTGKGPASSNISIIIDTINPDIVYNPTTETDNGGANRTWIFVNVTAIDANNDTVTFYLYNSTGQVYSNSSNYNSSEAITINWTGLSNDEVYYFNVTANDSATNENLTSTRTFYLDGTNPVATLSCSPLSVTRGSTVTCTCSGTDSGSGINSSATSAATTPSTSSTGTFTVTGCSVTDYAGNSDTASDSYTVTSSGGGTPTTYEWSLQKSHSWSKITPGVATIMKDFDKEIGLKQIQIEVNNEAQNVKITISKYDSKPSEVSIEKSGKTYRYLHINAENLEGKLQRAIIRVQVEKSWMVANSFEVSNMAMFKFNENNNAWDELTTIYTEADDEYYYYDVEVDSFSYFAIAEKVVVGEDEEETKKGLGWWWVAIIAGVIIIAYLVSVNKREISELFKK